MKKILATLALAVASLGAQAQSNPGLVFGQVPTAQQWNGYFATKQDVLVAPPYAVYGNPGGGSTYPQFLTVPSCSAAGQALTWNNGTGFGCAAIAGGGNVSTSGTLTSGAVVLGQGAQSVGVLASGNNSVLQTNGSGVVSWGTTLPSGLTLPSPIVTGTLGGTSVVPNTALVNASTTVNGTTCTLGSTCTVTSTTSLVNGSTPISGGTSGRVLYDNAGTLGELAPASAATANALAQRDANANIFFNNYFGNATATAAAAGTTTLTVASSRFQQLTTSGSNGQTYQLPDATTLPVGPVFKFNNNSAGILTINNAGGTSLYSLPAGGNTECSVLSNSTANGSWDCHSEIPNNSTWGTSGGIVLNTSLNTTPQISNGVASSTNPVFIPQRGTANNGFSGDSTHLYGIVGGSTVWTVTSTGVNSTAIGATTPSTGAFTSLTDTGITGSTQCLHANASGVISGTGSDCGSGSGGLTVGTTTISGGTSGNSLYDNAGVLGERTVTGTGSAVLATSPTLVTPALGTPSSATLTNATGLPLSTGVTGQLGVGNGGTGLASGTSGGVPCFTGTTTIASSSALGSGNLVLGGGAGVCPSSDSNASLSAGALTLGASGTAGSVTMGNATSGTLKIQPVTGALGTSTISLPAVTDTVGVLGTADQTMSGGVNLTSFSIGTVSSGTTTIDCGKNPAQYLTNNGAFTLAAPSNDGTCFVMVINGATAGAITFSGFSVGSSTGDALTTTNGNKFTLSIWRINGTAGYRIAAMQ